LTSKISENILKSNKMPAFIPFIVAGYPDMSATKDIMLCLQKNGAAAIELGIPFSDPLADGPVIQAAAKESLDSGTNIEKVFNFLEENKHSFEVPVILFTYFNLVLNYGLERFVERSKLCNISGFIIPDLPLEESDYLNELSKKANIDHIMLIAPTSDTDRIKAIAQKSSGFIYMVSSTGVTGIRDSFSTVLSDVINSIRQVSATPIAVGFGVSKPEHIKTLSKMNVQGSIIGSAIVKLIQERRHDKALMLKKLEEYINELYSG